MTAPTNTNNCRKIAAYHRKPVCISGDRDATNRLPGRRLPFAGWNQMQALSIAQGTAIIGIPQMAAIEATRWEPDMNAVNVSITLAADRARNHHRRSKKRSAIAVKTVGDMVEGLVRMRQQGHMPARHWITLRLNAVSFPASASL